MDDVEYRELPEWPGYRFGDDGSVWGDLSDDFSPVNKQAMLRTEKGCVPERPGLK